MCFKKNKEIALSESRQAIELNYKSLDALLAMCEEEKNIEELNSLRTKMQYMRPSSSAQVYKQDVKIKNTIEDTKILFAKKKTNEDEIVNEVVGELGVLIAERNKYI